MGASPWSSPGKQAERRLLWLALAALVLAAWGAVRLLSPPRVGPPPLRASLGAVPDAVLPAEAAPSPPAPTGVAPRPRPLPVAPPPSRPAERLLPPADGRRGEPEPEAEPPSPPDPSEDHHPVAP